MRDQIERALRDALSRRLDKETESLQRPVAADWEAWKKQVIEEELEDAFGLMTQPAEPERSNVVDQVA